MKKNHFILLFLLIPALIWAQGDKEPEIRTAKNMGTGEKTQFVQPFSGDVIDISQHTMGNLTVSVWDGDDVEITYVSYRDLIDHGLVEVRSQGGRLNISSSPDGSMKNMEGKIDMSLKVPKDMSLKMEIVSGDIDLMDMEGRFSGSVFNGNIILKNLKGEVDLKTFNGDISVRGSDLKGRTETMNGEIFLIESSPLDARTMNGTVTITSAGTLTNEDHQPLTIHSLNGDIDIKDAPNGIEADTMNGNITVLKAAEFARLDTKNGDIEVKLMNGPAEASTMNGSVSLVMAPENPDKSPVEISDFNGDVYLELPKDFSVNLYATIVVSRKQAKKVKIKSDFPVDIEEINPFQDDNVKFIITSREKGRTSVNISMIGGETLEIKEAR